MLPYLRFQAKNRHLGPDLKHFMHETEFPDDHDLA